MRQDMAGQHLLVFAIHDVTLSRCTIFMLCTQHATQLEHEDANSIQQAFTLCISLSLRLSLRLSSVCHRTAVDPGAHSGTTSVRALAAVRQSRAPALPPFDLPPFPLAPAPRLCHSASTFCWALCSFPMLHAPTNKPTNTTNAPVAGATVAV